jgi:hypothetical protein
MVPIDNPFSSRYIRPGAIAYRFRESTESAFELYERWKRLGAVAQIRGDHGSGKSTLLESLRPLFQADGFDLHQHVLAEPARDGRTLLAETGWTSKSVVMVDGYERLSHGRRWRLAFKRWRTGARLLITTHVDLGFAEVCALTPTVDEVVELAKHLQREHPVHVTDDDARAAFAHQKGNVREALFELFDVYQSRSQKAQGPPNNSNA